MIDELIDWGIEPPPVLGDGAYGDVTEFRLGLQERELQYVLDVKGGTSAYGEGIQPERRSGKGPVGRPRRATARSRLR